MHLCTVKYDQESDVKADYILNVLCCRLYLIRHVPPLTLAVVHQCGQCFQPNLGVVSPHQKSPQSQTAVHTHVYTLIVFHLELNTFTHLHVSYPFSTEMVLVLNLQCAFHKWLLMQRSETYFISDRV